MRYRRLLKQVITGIVSGVLASVIVSLAAYWFVRDNISGMEPEPHGMEAWSEQRIGIDSETANRLIRIGYTMHVARGPNCRFEENGGGNWAYSDFPPQLMPTLASVRMRDII